MEHGNLVEPANDCDESRIVYKVAADRHEREAAYRLLYDAYLRSGLIKSNPFAMRVTPYNLLPSTETFVALLRGEAICTMTLVGDGQLGLPLEAIYAEEVSRFRGRQTSLAEVSGLADRRRDIERFFPVFLRLVRVLCPYARRRGIERLIIAVHPKHARFYRRFLGFEQFGDVKSYPEVCDRPAIPLILDFASTASKLPHVHQLLFGAELSDDELRPRPMSEDERDQLRRVVEGSTSMGCEGAPTRAGSQTNPHDVFERVG